LTFADEEDDLINFDWKTGSYLPNLSLPIIQLFEKK
jgi:hypothetical protein